METWTAGWLMSIFPWDKHTKNVLLFTVFCDKPFHESEFYVQMKDPSQWLIYIHLLHEKKKKNTGNT